MLLIGLLCFWVVESALYRRVCRKKKCCQYGEHAVQWFSQTDNWKGRRRTPHALSRKPFTSHTSRICAIRIAMQTKGLIGPLNVKNIFPIKENMRLTVLMLLCYFWGDNSQSVWKSENCIELSKECCQLHDHSRLYLICHTGYACNHKDTFTKRPILLGTKKGMSWNTQ